MQGDDDLCRMRRSGEQIEGVFGADSRPHLVRPIVAAERVQELLANTMFSLSFLDGGLSVRVVEAMATGMPVIHDGNMRDARHRGERTQRIIILPANAMAIVRSVERLANSVELRTKPGRSSERNG